ncbi:MAG: ParB/RepB/Spo0J family partition protein [Proteobacteria bacterium]|nr:ParB/RepB/Spo0J family partition protein [Pseudomonadota bacterium]MBU4010442.1 ParB/RepB/Spo0J family partition protein [Pseudomonadota bacterium]MBU4037285.1 ParB/RepB/Spo0J family partition protein [Pseudomonadota bacterium]
MSKDPESKFKKKIALGKGLGALIPGIDTDEQESGKHIICDIGLIIPNQYQPRIHFSENELEELSQSIKEKGIIQPLLARKSSGGFELIAGERRLRAARMAGLAQVPLIVKNVSDAEMLEISIIENIQRENLNPIEEAEAYHRLMTEFDLTQEEASRRVGKSRPAVANILRLRQLPYQIKESLSDGKISMGHARALLGADTPAQQNAAWRYVVSKGLSVRETENLIKRLKTDKSKKKTTEKSSEDIYYLSLEDELSSHFGTKIAIKRQGKRGKIEIEFYSNEDLDNLISRLRQKQ